MPGDPQPTVPAEGTLGELRADFPGWRVQHHGRGALCWEAVRLRIAVPGGIARIVASEPGHLRELLTAATALNTRHLGRMP